MARRLIFAGLLSMVVGCTLLNSRADLLDGNDGASADGGDGAISTSDGENPRDGAQPGTDGESTTDGASSKDALAATPDADTDAVSTEPAPIYTGLLVPGGITVHATDVCWVAGQMPRGLYCAPSSGGALSAVREIDIAGDLSFLGDAFDIGMDDTSVYWSNGKNNQIVKRDLAGGTAAQYFSGGGRLAYLTLEGTTIFASDYSDTATAPGEVLYGPGNGVSSNVAYTGQSAAAGVAHADTTLYWGTGNPDQLNFGPDHGSATVTTIAMEAAVTGVAIDAQKTVYFIVGNQKVYRLLHGSISPLMIYDAGKSFGTSDIAVDDNAVYWTERDAGRVMRAPK